jgi:hypothetical protein
MKKYGFTTLDFGGTGNRFLDGKLDSVGCTDFGVGEHREFFCYAYRVHSHNQRTGKVMVESFRAIHEQTISLRNLQMNSSRWTETRK